MSKLRESKIVSMVATGVVAALGVTVITFAATTISSNISTGGTLTVTGASTLTGAVSAASTLGVTATSTFTGDAVFNKGVGVGANNSVAKTILISGLSTAPDSSEGRLYYNSASKILQLYDGTQWANVATSTTLSLTVSGNRLQLVSLNSYLTIGTTTQRGLSMLTLEATSTAGIPLSLVGYNGQTANLLQLLNSGSENLFYIDANGGFVTFASSTAASVFTVKGNLYASSTLTVSGDLTVNGTATTTASSGNFATAGTISATGLSTLTGGVLMKASSTVSSGNFTVTGAKLGVGTTSPATEVSTSGTATTTLYISSNTSNVGGCIQLRGSNGTDYRMYISPGDAGAYSTSTIGHGTFFALWEAGSCK